MTGRVQDILQAAGSHASRPTATTVANGTLYSCTDHDLIYRSDGSTWSTWATVGGAVGAASVGLNLVRNGRFRTNQRAYASAASLASGAYGFDGWKATTASTTLTYTSSPQGQAVTVNSGGSVAQVVEREDVPAGNYVLSWDGTATGRVYNSGGSAPSYAASPVTVTLDGLANVVVEFQASGATKTLDQVKLETGSTSSAYVLSAVASELAACQRYYWRRNYAGADDVVSAGMVFSATLALTQMSFPVRMRAVPSMTSSGSFEVVSGGGVQSVTLAFAEITVDGCQCNGTGVGMSTGSGTLIRAASAGAKYIEATADPS